MIDEKELLRQVADLQRETLHVWIERGWVSPGRAGAAYAYREIDVARIRLIQEFSTDLALDAEAMDVILPLLDQVHGLRRQLHRLCGAIDAQSEDVRARIREALDD